MLNDFTGANKVYTAYGCTDPRKGIDDLARQLYELGVVDASFIGLDTTPVMANTKQNNPKSFAKNKLSKENHPKSNPDCAPTLLR